jgi:phosphoribosylaminoimidazolecarboxamide formyltransferase / IMP cyclohydrolase
MVSTPASRPLKYGENPHQKAVVVLDGRTRDPLAIGKFHTVSGTPIADEIGDMGWVNLTDLDRGMDALIRIAAAFEENTGAVPCIAVLIEHGNVAGAAYGSSDQVLLQAINSNYRAAFGSFLVTNTPISRIAALAMRDAMAHLRPFSGIAAPEIDKPSSVFFKRKKGKCSMLVNPALANAGRHNLDSGAASRTIRGGTLTQEANTFVPRFPKTWDASLITDMCLAWGVCAASNSNTITIAKGGVLLANAVGQQERAAACELAVQQVRQTRRLAQLKGAAVVSDSFFAFADGFDILARRKVGAVFATSGSVHDKEVAEHARQFDVIFHTVPDTKGRVFAGH